MNRASAFFLSAAFAASVSAAPQIDVAALKKYAEGALTRCADGKVTLDRKDTIGPTGFVTFDLTQTSSDPGCGKKTTFLYSPSTQQILMGIVLPLPSDSRSADLRASQAVTDRIQSPVTATLSRGFPLPDGLKPISLIKGTQAGPFAYHGYLDASEQFLIVGTRGNLRTDPRQTLVENLGLGAAVRRGNPKAALKIIEISDFQCPTCGRAHKVVEPIVAKNLSKIDYYRLDLPLFEMHQWSLDAATGARAIERVAPKQYWDYVNFVFNNQEMIDKMKSFDVVLQNFVEDHDISWPAVEKIYRSPAERTALVEQVSRTMDLGINSTPTYIINGQIIGYGPEGKSTIAALKKAIGVK